MTVECESVVEQQLEWENRRKSKEVLLQFHIILNATQATGAMTEAILEPHLT